ncbi:toll/interleukin-1 receptor domain-containing protein [Streptococcus constellatus]|uniref:toll/interleukin-1 receptor domain-containing protein n=1 Tax=Streptococcus constellatus TaxID=76860 RepID=UPI000E5B6255|nr:toll/interleukin-1 receptor domain-containing protein [Streptococcus constellatus]RID96711.1 toll/interleukin-1 receptor domain-containing protein [Streptococcus constellatus]
MTDVFISYRREDGLANADFLSEKLTNSGCRVFFDKKNIPPGADFDHAIKTHLEQCNDVLLVVTKSYFGKKDLNHQLTIHQDSDWVRKEIALALSQNKTIVPILFNGVPLPEASDIPDDIRAVLKRQYIKVSNDDDWDFLMNKIKNSLSQNTQTHMKFGQYVKIFNTISQNKKNHFTDEIKNVCKKLNEEKINKQLIPLLNSDESNDIKFLVYYTIFTFYRRREEKSKIYNFIEKYSSYFEDYPFNNIVLSQYYKFKYDENIDDFESLDKAICFVNEARKQIQNNYGVYITYSELVAIGLENNYLRYKKHIQEAIKSIDKANQLNKDYPKNHYIHGKLLAFSGDYTNGINFIKRAIDLEDRERTDSFIRILQYSISKESIIYKMENQKLEERLKRYIILNSLFLIVFIIILCCLIVYFR